MARENYFQAMYYNWLHNRTQQLKDILQGMPCCITTTPPHHQGKSAGNPTSTQLYWVWIPAHNDISLGNICVGAFLGRWRGT